MYTHTHFVPNTWRTFYICNHTHSHTHTCTLTHAHTHAVYFRECWQNKWHVGSKTSQTRWWKNNWPPTNKSAPVLSLNVSLKKIFFSLPCWAVIFQLPSLRIISSSFRITSLLFTILLPTYSMPHVEQIWWQSVPLRFAIFQWFFLIANSIESS